MGSGASRRGKAKAAGEAGEGLLAPGSSPSKGAPPRVSVPPALRRRRRVLFGPGAAAARREFEDVAPRDQFTADIPEDPIFDRFGSFQVIHGFLRRAEEIQHHGNDGYLEENAIELLELGLEVGSTLARRLFQVAQAQQIVSLGARRPLLTCYELLALSSLFRAGEDADLLEFLYCVFDVDADDRLSIEDLTVSIDAFLGLRDAAEGLERQEDRDDFAKLDERARHVEARHMAEQAMKEYGVTEAEPEPEEEEEENEEPEGEEAAEKAEDADEEEVVKVPSKKGSQHSLVSGAGEGASLRRRRRGGVDEDSDSDDDGSKSQKSVSSTKPGHHQDGGSDFGKPVKKKRTSLCGGRKQADSDSDSSNADKEEEPLKPQPKAKRSRSRGLCRGAPPADESSDGETAPLTLPKPKAKPKAKPKPKPRAKRRSRSLCSVGGRRKLPPALGFEQWKCWLAASQFLPIGFAGLPPPAAPPAEGEEEAEAAKGTGPGGRPLAESAPGAGAALAGRQPSSVGVTSAARRASFKESDSDDSM